MASGSGPMPSVTSSSRSKDLAEYITLRSRRLRGWIEAFRFNLLFGEFSMMMKTMLGALALTLSTTAFAEEPASPANECRCCKKDGEKMACCDDHDKSKPSAENHDGHDMDGMNHK